MNEIKINKQAKSITFINNGIAFSQFGIAKEILDLVDNQQQEIERLNNKINKDLDKFNDELNTFKWLENDFKEHSIHYYQLECLVEYLKQLKENK